MIGLPPANFPPVKRRIDRGIEPEIHYAPLGRESEAQTEDDKIETHPTIHIWAKSRTHPFEPSGGRSSWIHFRAYGSSVVR